MPFTPCEKLANGQRVRRARILVPNRRREKFNEAPGRGFARANDRTGQPLETRADNIAGWNRDDFRFFFRLLPCWQLTYHNVLYDTPMGEAVKVPVTSILFGKSGGVYLC
jgi:hypothetical protein